MTHIVEAILFHSQLMSSSLPKITKSQAGKIIDLIPGVRVNHCILDDARCSEDYWSIVLSFRPSIELLNSVLNNRKPSTKKKATTKKKKAM